MNNNRLPFFRDTPHSLEDVDRLARSMNYMAETIGEEKARQIEEYPEDFFNGNRFRYYQFKGWHRSIPFTFVATLGGVFAIGGFKNSNNILKSQKLPILLFSVATLFISQRLFEYRNGYKNADYLAHNYAKYLIMTRNLKIKG
jgi:hypothetical protein